MDNQKPISEWTLGDVKEYCGKQRKSVDRCDGCKIRDLCDKYLGKQGLSTCPHYWNLSEKPNFTAGEVADARTIMRMFPWCEKIARTNSGKLCLLGHRPNKHWDRELMGESLFPSIHPGQCISLSEIVGDKE